jgi:putative transposase
VVPEQTSDQLRRAKKEPVKWLFHDPNLSSLRPVDADLAKRRIGVCKTAFRAPNTNAYVERFMQTIQQECLDHFVILGERHFHYLVKEWLEHYHTERPHQAKENELLLRPAPKVRKGRRGDLPGSCEIRCRQRLGGLLTGYFRKAG